MQAGFRLCSIRRWVRAALRILTKVTRRGFLASGVATASAAILSCRKTVRPIAGSFVNDSSALGHRLRDQTPSFTPPRQTLSVPVVIVGGGIAGLSAAWRLRNRGLGEFVLLEMEAEAELPE